MFRFKNQIVILTCFQLNYLKTLKAKLFFKKRLSHAIYIGHDNENIILSSKRRKRFYSNSLLNYMIYNFRCDSMLKFSITLLDLKINSSKFFPKKIEKTVRIFYGIYGNNDDIHNNFKCIEACPLNRNIIMFWILNSYLEQIIFLNFQKNILLKEFRKHKRFISNLLSNSSNKIFFIRSNDNSDFDSSYLQNSDIFLLYKLCRFLPRIFSKISLFWKSANSFSIFAPIFFRLSFNDPWKAFDQDFGSKTFLKKKEETVFADNIEILFFKIILIKDFFLEKSPLFPAEKKQRSEIISETKINSDHNFNFLIWRNFTDCFKIKIFSAKSNIFLQNYLPSILSQFNEKEFLDLKFFSFFLNKDIDFEVKWKKEKFLKNLLEVLTCNLSVLSEKKKRDVHLLIDALFFSCLSLTELPLQCLVYLQSKSNIRDTQQKKRKCSHILFGCQQYFGIYLFF